jgi:hypothetical protein
MLYFSRDTRLVTMDRKPDILLSYRDGEWLRKVWFSFRIDATGPSRRACCIQLPCSLQVAVCNVSFCHLCQRTLLRHQTQQSLKKCLFTKKFVFDRVSVFFESVKSYTLHLLYRFRCALRIWVRMRGSLVVTVAFCEPCAVTALCQLSIYTSVGAA